MLKEESITNLHQIKSGKNFLGILNDIKRRPEDAANELNVTLEEIQAIIEGIKPLTPIELKAKGLGKKFEYCGFFYISFVFHFSSFKFGIEIPAFNSNNVSFILH